VAPTTKRIRRTGGSGEFPRLLAGRLCLDFANTVEDPRGAAEDFLHDYADVARWSRHAGAIDDAELARLDALAMQHPERADLVTRQALDLRRSIDRAFRNVASGASLEQGDRQRIQREYLQALSSASLRRHSDNFSWSWSWLGVADLRLPVWLVAASAVELLTEGELARVKQCPGADDCGWLFYDSSRNATRRWCSMEGCGSRVKMRRHYARHRRATR
jgi:predicted RNA-binding Zn ribbon-like protein